MNARLAMGIQEVYIVHGAESVREVLRTPSLTGWPNRSRRQFGERRINWDCIENDIRTTLAGNLKMKPKKTSKKKVSRCFKRTKRINVMFNEGI